MSEYYTFIPLVTAKVQCPTYGRTFKMYFFSLYPPVLVRGFCWDDADALPLLTGNVCNASLLLLDAFQLFHW